jgi:glycosyltransferase involved in cell wall biosynthesis
MSRAAGARSERRRPVSHDAARSTAAGARRAPVCMIVHAYYEEDPRVRRQAEALAAAGWSVDVFGLRREGEKPTGTIAGVNVHRLPVGRHQGAGLAMYVMEYGSFLVRAMFAATRAHSRRHYGLIQVHSMPDYLVFAAAPIKLAGVSVLLDLHEVMAEFFKIRFPGASNPITNAALRLQERLSIAFADEVLTVCDPFAERLLRNGLKPERLTVVMNSPDLRLFDPSVHPRRALMADGALRIVYTGALTPIYELDVLLRAVARVRSLRPDLPMTVAFYGRGDSMESLASLAAELGLTDLLTMPGRVPIEQVAAIVADSDVGIAPTRLDPFTEMTLSGKVLEYAAMGKPVVASRLPSVEGYFAADTLAFYEPGSPDSMAEAILALVDDPAEAAARVERTGRRVEELSWARQFEAYRGVVERLQARTAARKRRPARQAGPSAGPGRD